MTTASTTSLEGFPTQLTPAQLLYPDLRGELETTRRVLERVPDGDVDWTPHEKSTSIGKLATHLATLPLFAQMMLTSSDVDVLTVQWPPQLLPTTAERLALFDSLAEDMRTRVEAADWATLSERWTMRMGDHIILNDTKATLLRTLGLSHMAHHRAQLGVYLRLKGVAVPRVYGPTADEPM